MMPPWSSGRRVTVEKGLTRNVGRLARIPILLIVLGFGSPILEHFNYHFTLLAWADDYQPVAGVMIGLLGVALLLLLRARSRAGQTQGGHQVGAGYTGPGGPGAGGVGGVGGPAGYGPPPAAPMPPGSPMPTPPAYGPRDPNGPAEPRR